MCCSQRGSDVAERVVGAHRLYSGASVPYDMAIVMRTVKRNCGEAAEELAMAWTRARGESLGAGMAYSIASIIDWAQATLTERERLLVTAALNSSCLLIMSSNCEHLWWCSL